MDTQIQVNGQPVSAVLAVPESGSGPGVLVLHAWWGLNTYFRDLCEQLAAQGYLVLAPDLYTGRVAATIEQAEEYLNATDPQQIGDTVMAARDFLLAHPACESKTLGVIGFSMGAAWSLVAAAREPQKIGAVVLFYGAYEVEFDKVSAPVLGHFSPEDEWEPYDQIQALEGTMRQAGINVNFHSYPGQKHWFAETNRPEYDPESARLAWQRTFEFLREHVK